MERMEAAASPQEYLLLATQDIDTVYQHEGELPPPEELRTFEDDNFHVVVQKLQAKEDTADETLEEGIMVEIEVGLDIDEEGYVEDITDIDYKKDATFEIETHILNSSFGEEEACEESVVAEADPWYLHTDRRVYMFSPPPTLLATCIHSGEEDWKEDVGKNENEEDDVTEDGEDDGEESFDSSDEQRRCCDHLANICCQFVSVSI
jgi:hypothetical protein